MEYDPVTVVLVAIYWLYSLSFDSNRLVAAQTRRLIGGFIRCREHHCDFIKAALIAASSSSYVAAI